MDVVRHWQDLGYLIIYVTGRPCMQLQKVTSSMMTMHMMTDEDYKNVKLRILMMTMSIRMRMMNHHSWLRIVMMMITMIMMMTMICR